MGKRKRESAAAAKEASKNIAFAKLNNCPTSPRKMRLVADQVRGEEVNKALAILKFMPTSNMPFIPFKPPMPKRTYMLKSHLPKPWKMPDWEKKPPMMLELFFR